MSNAKKNVPRNTVASAMNKRYRGNTVHADKRAKRKNRRSWRNEVQYEPEEDE